MLLDGKSFVFDGSLCSSTAIREAIRTGNITAANRMLGHTWLLEADFDRENPRQIVPHGDMILPPPGRYAVTLSALAARPRVFRHATIEVLHRVLQATGNGLPAALPEKLGVAFEKRLSER